MVWAQGTGSREGTVPTLKHCALAGRLRVSWCSYDRGRCPSSPALSVYLSCSLSISVPPFTLPTRLSLPPPPPPTSTTTTAAAMLQFVSFFLQLNRGCEAAKECDATKAAWKKSPDSTEAA